MKLTAIVAGTAAVLFAASAVAQEITPPTPPPAPVPPASSCGEFPAAPAAPANARRRTLAAAQPQYDSWRAQAQLNLDCRAAEYRALQAETNARAAEYQAALAAGQAAGDAWQAVVGGTAGGGN